MIFFLHYKNKYFEKKHITSSLEIIPKNERIQLELFFRYLLMIEPSAYVLFGDKPMASAGYVNEQDPCSYLKRCAFFSWHSMDDKILKNGWEVWQKYRHLFPLDNFIFRKIEGTDVTMILLINKKSFLRAIEENFNDFTHVLGDEFSGEKLLEQFTTEKSPYDKPLRNHSGLLGILYGFGRHNALLFQQRNEVLKMLNSKRAFSLRSDPLRQELHVLNQKLQFFGDKDIFNPFLFMYLPMFAAELNHPETIKLKNKYRQQRQKISEIYGNGNFLEITLLKLCEKSHQ